MRLVIDENLGHKFVSIFENYFYDKFISNNQEIKITSTEKLCY